METRDIVHFAIAILFVIAFLGLLAWFTVRVFLSRVRSLEASVAKERSKFVDRHPPEPPDAAEDELVARVCADMAAHPGAWYSPGAGTYRKGKVKVVADAKGLTVNNASIRHTRNIKALQLELNRLLLNMQEEDTRSALAEVRESLGEPQEPPNHLPHPPVFRTSDGDVWIAPSEEALREAEDEIGWPVHLMTELEIDREAPVDVTPPDVDRYAPGFEPE